MQVKTVNATAADKSSAQVLFDSLFGLRELYWPGKQTIRVLDAFARNGQLTVSQCVNRPGVTVSAWELGPEHEQALWDLGCAEVAIGCSYEQVQRSTSVTDKYDLIVIDTPQGLHKSYDGKVRSEHWDFMGQALSLVHQSAVFVLYVNTDPYDARILGEHGYDTYSEYDYDQWMVARRRFYGQARPHIDQALTIYRKVAWSWGWEFNQPLVVPCLSDVPGKAPYAYRVAFKVSI